MNVIYKYCIDLATALNMPVRLHTYAKFSLLTMQLSVLNPDLLCLWAAVDPGYTAPPYLSMVDEQGSMEQVPQSNGQVLSFRVMTTGTYVDAGHAYYVGTVQQPNGRVWHLFCDKPIDPWNPKHFQ